MVALLDLMKLNKYLIDQDLIQDFMNMDHFKGKKLWDLIELQKEKLKRIEFKLNQISLYINLYHKYFYYI